jgi:hypothetical protein
MLAIAELKKSTTKPRYFSEVGPYFAYTLMTGQSPVLSDKAHGVWYFSGFTAGLGAQFHELTYILEFVMQKVIIFLVALGINLACQLPAHAGIISVIGTGQIIPAPSNVGNNGAGNNGNQHGFNEKQNYLLNGSLTADSSQQIAANQYINSHMIFLNRTDTSNNAVTATATWTFDGLILGVFSDQNGANLFATDFLGAAGTTYPNAPFQNRGLESKTPNNTLNLNGDDYLINGATLSVTMRITQPGDWIRVVTAAPVPIPAAVWMLGTALVGLVGVRRIKKI